LPEHELLELFRGAVREGVFSEKIVGNLFAILRESIKAGEEGEGVSWWEWYATKFVRYEWGVEHPGAIHILPRTDRPAYRTITNRAPVLFLRRR
jgi:hypothetical protein